jgi:hypothetical protein
MQQKYGNVKLKENLSLLKKGEKFGWACVYAFIFLSV